VDGGIERLGHLESFALQFRRQPQLFLSRFHLPNFEQRLCEPIVRSRHLEFVVGQIRIQGDGLLECFYRLIVLL
jgi:hypothetical protein